MTARRTLVLALIALALTAAAPGLFGHAWSWLLHRRPAVRHIPDQVRVYFPTEKVVRTLDLEEYVRGVVAAEMPATFADEALKAQMVVARTYTVRRLLGQSAHCTLNPKADVCADPTVDQAYISRGQYRAHHGWWASVRFWRRLEAATAQTDGLIVVYNGKPIEALYHSDSVGATESALAFAGKDIPYLRSVKEPYGANAPRAHAVTVVSLSQVANSFKQAPQSVKGNVRILTWTPGGRAAAVQVGTAVVTAREFRRRLGLNSTDFTLEQDGGALMIHSRGFGHGVGMSQYGANDMARTGADFRRIIAHYYTRVAIQPL